MVIQRSCPSGRGRGQNPAYRPAGNFSPVYPPGGFAAELKRRLRKIPDRARLIVDGTKALYVDRDIYETIREFETAASFRGITLEYHNFHDKQLNAG